MTDTEARPAAGGNFDSAEHQARLAELYRDFEAAGMTPLWLTREGLMPAHPKPKAVPHLWRYQEFSAWMTDSMHDADGPALNGPFRQMTALARLDELFDSSVAGRLRSD